MADYIDRQAAIEVADAVWSVTGDVNVAKVWDQLRNLPSADAVEVRNGTWIEDKYNDLDYVCSKCGEPCGTMTMGKPRDRYCKWCGARMDGEQNG